MAKRSREYVSYQGGKLPTDASRRRLRAALMRFEHALIEWLRNPMREREPRPTPAEFGLKPAHVATIIRHCESVARRHGDLSLSE